MCRGTYPRPEDSPPHEAHTLTQKRERAREARRGPMGPRYATTNRMSAMSACGARYEWVGQYKDPRCRFQGLAQGFGWLGPGCPFARLGLCLKRVAHPPPPLRYRGTTPPKAGRKLLCAGGGGGGHRSPFSQPPPPPSLATVTGGGGSGRGRPTCRAAGGGGGVNPTSMAQNDTHVALIILTTQMWGGGIIGGKNFFGPDFVFLCLWRQHPFLHKTKGPTRNPISPTPPPPLLRRASMSPPPPPPPQSNFQVAQPHHSGEPGTKR